MNPAAERVLDRARRQGAEDAEVYISRGTEFTVKVYKQEIESLVSAESRGIGLRTLRERRVGFSYTSDTDDLALDALVEEALENGRYNHPDEANVLPETQPIEPLNGLYSPALSRVDPQRKIDFALEMERRAISLDPRVKRVSEAVYSDGSGQVEIYNSRGLGVDYQRSVAYGVLETIAEAGTEMQSGFAFTHGRDMDALDLEAVALEAVENAAGLLGASRVPTAKVPVVLHPHAAAMILGILSSAFSADAVLKGRSLLAGRVGQAVASDLVTITDDARLPDGLASRPFDGEGVPSRRTELIQQGTLRGYLHNTYTARRSGDRSTGSAVRSYKSVPEVGVTNLVLTPGDIDRDALLSRVSNGLHVSQLHGLNTVNPVSGEFSLGLTGHWIENGQLTRPVRELTVAGNVIDLLKRVSAVASDLRFIFAGGFVGSPTVLIDELPVGGL
ncbi:MAG: TldD/PmbA family protein [Candidatus Dormibacteraeota bacterium]|nr:TldD/PmbA family protein [Candidatus Dormibacteraeota bacterium]